MLRKISSIDFQYLFIFAICLFFFFITDVLGLLDKVDYSYWSGKIITEPYRVFTSHFIHGDTNHLLANIFGIVICRYCLISQGLKSNYFFLVFVFLILPVHSWIFMVIDIYIFNNYNSISIGFSGVIYGFYAFLLLSSIYGKKNFLGLKIHLNKNIKVRKIMSIILLIGFLFSLLPGISFLGHFSGLLSGILLYFI